MQRTRPQILISRIVRAYHLACKIVPFDPSTGLQIVVDLLEDGFADVETCARQPQVDKIGRRFGPEDQRPWVGIVFGIVPDEGAVLGKMSRLDQA